MQRHWYQLGLVSLLSLAGGAWVFHPPSSDDRPAAGPSAELFQDVVETIRDRYVDSVDGAGLYTEAARRTIGSLHDPYSDLLTGQAFHEHFDQLAGAALGEGLETGLATASGPDDRLELGGTPAASRGRLLRKGVGYVHLSSVTRHSAAELQDAVDALVRQGARSLILDLRMNPGGLIAQGVAVSRLFLDAGDTVAIVTGRIPEHTRTYVDTEPERWPGLRLAVLVNRGTASSAELIAGALQDHDRAALVGSRTYGKGVVQTTFPLASEAAVKLTTARWYTPRGRHIGAPLGDSTARRAPDSIRKTGLVPDRTVYPRRTRRSERAFVQALGPDIEIFHRAVDELADDLVTRGAVRRADAAVTPSMRERLRQRLVRHEVAIDAGTFGAAESYVSEQLGYALARAVGGDAAETVRRARDDQQVQSAIAYLTGRSAAKR